MNDPTALALAAKADQLAIEARRDGAYDAANFWAEYAYQASLYRLPWWDPKGGPLFPQFWRDRGYLYILP